MHSLPTGSAPRTIRMLRGLCILKRRSPDLILSQGGPKIVRVRIRLLCSVISLHSLRKKEYSVRALKLAMKFRLIAQLLVHLAVLPYCRGYLARRATARRRYRYWTRERARRAVFLEILEAANAANCQVTHLSELPISAYNRVLSESWFASGEIG